MKRRLRRRRGRGYEAQDGNSAAEKEEIQSPHGPLLRNQRRQGGGGRK